MKCIFCIPKLELSLPTQQHFLEICSYCGSCRNGHCASALDSRFRGMDGILKTGILPDVLAERVSCGLPFSQAARRPFMFPA